MKKLFISFAFVLLALMNFNESVAQCVTCVGDNTASIGSNNNISGTDCFIAGKNSSIVGNYNTIIGSSSSIESMYSYITGYYSSIDGGSSSYIFGEHCTIGNTYSMLLGYNLKTNTGNSFALGYGNIGNELTTTVPYSLIIGFKSSYPTFFVGPALDGQESGRIGIGNVTDPLAKLHLKADIEEDADFLIESTGTDKIAVIYLSGKQGIIKSKNEGEPLVFITNEESRITIDGTNGNVGIGTGQPSAKLEITDGDIFINDISRGIIMKSPDGNCWRGTLNNEGQLVFTVLEDCASVAVKETKTDLNFKIYPNPANGYIEISMPEIKSTCVATIFSIKGELLKSVNITDQLSRIDISGLKSGSYLIKVMSADQVGTETLVIK